MSQERLADLMQQAGFPKFTQQVLAKAERGPRGVGRGVTIGEGHALARIVGADPAALLQPPGVMSARIRVRALTARLREQIVQEDFAAAALRATRESLEAEIAAARDGMRGSLAGELAAAEKMLREGP